MKQYDPGVTAYARTGTYIGRRNEKGTITYKGIRYASFQGRWKPASELPESDEVFEAYELGPACPQTYLIPDAKYDAPFPRMGMVPYSEEDCFSLGLSTGSLTGKKPVFVFIHGGANTFGGTFDPTFRTEAFVDINPDIVFVIFNYRLSFLGTIYLGEIDKTGEYADSTELRTMDQTLALKWVHDNISAFGGDPENVTIGGQSAGSFNVQCLCTYKPAQEYFHRAVMQSASSIAFPPLSVEAAAGATRTLMKKMGAKSLQEMLDASVEDVLRQEYGLWTMSSSLIGKDVSGMLCSGESDAVHGIDILIGTTESEFEPPMNEKTTAREIRPVIRAAVGDALRNVSESSARYMSELYFPGQDPESVTSFLRHLSEEELDEILDAYIRNDPERDPIIALTTCLNDITWWQPTEILARNLSRRNQVFTYLWTWCPPGHFPNRAKHAVELGFMTGNLDLPNDPALGIHPPELVGYIQEVWGSFIRTGRPDSEALTAVPYTAEAPLVMKIDIKPEYIQIGREEDMSTLRRVYEKHHK